jgi:hypothetical protein
MTAAIWWRGQQAIKWIGCAQDEQTKARGNQPQHRNHPCHHHIRQLPREQADSQRPAIEQQ